MSVGQENIDFYKKNLKEKGIIKFEKLFDQSLLKNIHNKYKFYFDTNIISNDRSPGLSVNKKLVKYLNFPFVISKEAINLATNKQIINIASDYLQDEIKLSYVVAYRTQEVSNALRYYYNTPGVFSGWHSDNQLQTFGHRMLTTIIYLTDVKSENGPLEVAEKTFNLGKNKRVFFEEEIKNYKKNIITGNFGTTILFDMDSVHKANIPLKGFRDVIRFSYSPKNGYIEKLYFIAKDVENDFDEHAKNIINFYDNKDQYKNFVQKKKKLNFKDHIYNIKEKIIFFICTFEFFAKLYFKRRVRILKSKNKSS